MKKLIPFLVLLVATTVAVAQGTVNFANSVAFTTATNESRLVYGFDGLPVFGSPTDQPPAWVAQLLYGANASSLQAHTAAPARFRPGNTGLWLGGIRTLTGFTGGQTVTLRVIAWDARTGATFDTAGIRGSSQTFTYTIPTSPLAPPSDFFMENFRGFTLIPEPAATLLLGAAIPALWLVMRRRARERSV